MSFVNRCVNFLIFISDGSLESLFALPPLLFLAWATVCFLLSLTCDVIVRYAIQNGPYAESVNRAPPLRHFSFLTSSFLRDVVELPPMVKWFIARYIDFYQLSAIFLIFICGLCGYLAYGLFGAFLEVFLISAAVAVMTILLRDTVSRCGAGYL